MMRLFVFLGLFLVVSANTVERQRPVNKVINLLKDMIAQLDKEAKQDEEIYDKLACWCRTNETEKNEAVDTANRRIEDLTAKIEELTAKSSELNVTIKKTKEELAENKQSLAKATSLREKEAKEAHASEKDLLQSIEQLKSAVTILSKHHALNQEKVVAIQTLMRKSGHTTDEIADLFGGKSAFLEVDPHASASGEIFGVLKQMLESFQANLSDSTKAEQAAAESFANLKAAKTEEIAAAEQLLEDKEDDLAETDTNLANSKQDLEDTEKALAADTQFLADLKERCSTSDKDWEARQKTRNEEKTALQDTIGILTSDEAHANFGKSLGFYQTAERVQSERQERAAALLSEQATKTNNPELAVLATSVQLNAFTKVKKMIDQMVADLQAEKEAEIKKKDYCNDEFHKNETETTAAERTKDQITTKIEQTEAEISELSSSIATLKKEVADAGQELQKATIERQAQNKEFQQTVQDQVETQRILKMAMERLAEFYGKQTTSTLLQAEPGAETTAPPPGLSKGYKKSAGSLGVVSLIEDILNDSKELQAEAVHDEKDAQASYADFVKTSNTIISTKNNDIVNKTEAKADKEEDLASAKGDLKATNKQLDSLSKYNGDLHEDCDFVLKNFDIRQTARDEEVEALRQAKSILSGAQ